MCLLTTHVPMCRHFAEASFLCKKNKLPKAFSGARSSLPGATFLRAFLVSPAQGIHDRGESSEQSSHLSRLPHAVRLSWSPHIFAMALRERSLRSRGAWRVARVMRARRREAAHLCGWDVNLEL